MNLGEERKPSHKMGLRFTDIGDRDPGRLCGLEGLDVYPLQAKRPSTNILLTGAGISVFGEHLDLFQTSGLALTCQSKISELETTTINFDHLLDYVSESRACEGRLIEIKLGGSLEPPVHCLGDQTSETVTPAAERYAKSLGIYGFVILVKSILKQTMRSSLLALYVDLREDPDDHTSKTICFYATVRLSADEAIELDESVQSQLVASIPPVDRVHLSISYEFK
jgi:hypothetical protein